MKIINNTNFDTKILRKIFSVALRLNEKSEGKYLRKKQLKVEVVSARQEEACTGWAYIGIPHMRIKIHPNFTNVKAIAFVFEHELYHNRGYRHDKMPKMFMCYGNSCNYNGWSGKNIDAVKERYKELENVQLLKKQIKKEKEKEDIKEKRYNKIIIKIDDIKRKIKRYENMLKKYSNKKKYYEKQFSLAAKNK